ncbi:putative nucleotidyltransferase [Halanaerobium saccharolyticum]|uniref:tRNA(Met) cytidine acetate ligase n=1 Tax=Halanaerobium saccharolyticum TaxID=43595 RepID=A0A4R7YWX4_9FIRM|nr:nucleotidyltransferase family protein [Halanaerobium saccharolyticum]RAK06210.1 putative nucleotidyltransferase [Halanaerobium saccharolyticum]TDW00575.1 putative nucleotidyltransferase [Halanaerobium saccharolyticum]TDX52240.1 putative nucleotidyltransferase [Halanaerobium saccharolyticum]
MSVTALIVEYNPFHNGHQYHLNQSKKITKNDDLIVIMSGNYTQRGEAALLDKWARTEQALSCGADLVLELPLTYNIRSAEYFAYYSVLSLAKSNLVDSIVFGSEAGDIKILAAVAEALVRESSNFKKELQKHLTKGVDFPTARRRALIADYQSNSELRKYNKNRIEEIIKAPNNILGIEYLKALSRLNSKIKAHTIKRVGTDYHSQKVNKNYASASLIRNLINTKPQTEALTAARKLMPADSWKILKREIEKGRFVKKDCKTKILSKTVDQLRRSRAQDLKKFKGIKNGLENRIIEKAAASFKADSFLNSLKSKNLTESRIKRKILQIYFGLDAEKINIAENNAPHYLRVLGLKKGKENLLSLLQQKSEVEIIINPAAKINELNLNSKDPLILSLSYDLLASNLYALLYQNSNHSQARRDFYQKFIKV